MKPILKKCIIGAVLVLALLGATLLTALGQQPNTDTKRGEYIVKGSGCSDCHTPMKMGPSGSEPDMIRLFSGHPQALVMPPAPKLPPGPWLTVASATFTAWSGPWGISFTSNLTPDKDTGLGSWKTETFINTIRSGRIMGRGRQLLPPMPYQALQNLEDTDLQAIFAYLQTIPVIVNKVPDPVPPLDAGGN
jgi:hypothetical protein